jgi:signal peptidase I
VNEPDSVSTAESVESLESEPVDPTEDVPTAEVPKARNRTLRWVIEVVVIVAAAFVLALVVQQFLVKPFAIPSPSMEPTLMEGDRVLVNRLVYHFRAPHRGDVIVFHPPNRPGSDPFIKRIVAVGGDTIEVRDGYLYVNGVRQDEKYIKEYPIVGDFPQTVIPAGYIWAMGDNRNDSGDSRVFGPVSVDAIMGEAFAIYWPINHLSGL